LKIDFPLFGNKEGGAMTGWNGNHGLVHFGLVLSVSFLFGSHVWGGITKTNTINDPPPPILPKPLFSGKLLQPLYPKSCPPYFKENYGYTRQKWQRWPGFVNPNPPMEPVPVPVEPASFENPEKPNSDNPIENNQLSNPGPWLPSQSERADPAQGIQRQPIVLPSPLNSSASNPYLSWHQGSADVSESKKPESQFPDKQYEPPFCK
jgi:hypothetical protein